MALLAAFAGEVDRSAQIAVRSARTDFAGLRVPAIGEDVSDHVIAGRDAVYRGLELGCRSVGLHESIGYGGDEVNLGAGRGGQSRRRILPFIDANLLAEIWLGHG